MEPTRPRSFEQYVKMSGKWDRLPVVYKKIVKAMSSNRRTHIGLVVRYGRTGITKLYSEYEKEVLKPKGNA